MKSSHAHASFPLLLHQLQVLLEKQYLEFI